MSDEADDRMRPASFARSILSAEARVASYRDEAKYNHYLASRWRRRFLFAVGLMIVNWTVTLFFLALAK